MMAQHILALRLGQHRPAQYLQGSAGVRESGGHVLRCCRMAGQMAAGQLQGGPRAQGWGRGVEGRTGDREVVGLVVGEGQAPQQLLAVQLEPAQLLRQLPCSYWP